MECALFDFEDVWRQAQETRRCVPNLETRHIRLLKQIRFTRSEAFDLTSSCTIECARTVNDLIVLGLVDPIEGGIWLCGGMMYGTVLLSWQGKMALEAPRMKGVKGN